MVLFATDIAARGLDFAKLDWVLQMDCPEDVPAYIHRVGRTARYVSGKADLLVLLERQGSNGGGRILDPHKGSDLQGIVLLA